MTNPKDTLLQLHKNLNHLEERRVKYAGNEPLDLRNQIDDHKTAIQLIEQALAGELSETDLEEALEPLLVDINRRGGVAKVPSVRLKNVDFVNILLVVVLGVVLGIFVSVLIWLSLPSAWKDRIAIIVGPPPPTPTFTPTPTPTPSCPKNMALVPESDDGPAFCLDMYEVTNGVHHENCEPDEEMCLPCERKEGCKTLEVMDNDRRAEYLGESFQDRPVVWVTQQQAINYCRSIGKRLPTGKEWERLNIPPGKPTDKAFPDPVGTKSDDVVVLTATKVYTIYDLGNNVQEWVNDSDELTRGVSFLSETGTKKPVTKGDPKEDIGFRCAQEPILDDN